MTYEKQFKTLGGDLDELQLRLQTQIDVMQGVIVQLEQENKMQRQVIERLSERLSNIESLEGHVLTYSYRKPEDYIGPIKSVDDEVNEIVMSLRDDELESAWLDMNDETRSTLSPEAKKRFAKFFESLEDHV